MTAPNINIHGAGIAGLWTARALTAAGYKVTIFEKNAIGSGQTIASQGILHSGLKYALTGKISTAAKKISAMPGIWRRALPEDCFAAPSQMLLIPRGIAGGVIKAASSKIFRAQEISTPPALAAAGFNGTVLSMNEPVLDVPKVLRVFAKDMNVMSPDPRLRGDDTQIFTAAEGNADMGGPEIQRRPLLMGMIKNAPFDLFAHCVGASEKPVMTITTHTTKNGVRVWYIGGQVAERAKESNPDDLYRDIQTALKKYMPELDMSGFEWDSLPIDRIESKMKNAHMPDGPSIHQDGNKFYCLPTKLTFAPLLAEMVLEKIIHNRHPGESRDLPGITQKDPDFRRDDDYLKDNNLKFAQTPWDITTWKKFN